MDIYPNPSNGVYTISYALEKQTQLQIAVLDLMGRQVTEERQLSTLSGNERIDLSKEAEGVYMLRVVMDSKRVLQQRLVLVK
jgi:hypothetical protein